MPTQQDLNALTEQLADPSVVQRRAAVRRAADLLADPACTTEQRLDIIDILRKALSGERYTTVRDDIQAILKNVWDNHDPTITDENRQYMIGVRCPKQHITYYDRRRVCSDATILYRSRMRDPNRKSNEYYVDCLEPGCDQVVKIELDCGDYRP